METLQHNEVNERQKEITRLCIQVAIMLLQHGAESTLIDQLTNRVGLALGVDSVECALTPNAIVVSTIKNGHCITTARKNNDKGINMYVVTEIQHIVIAAERGIYDIQHVRRRLDTIKPLKYNRYLVIVMVGISCASFAHLSGGDIVIGTITFIASAFAMAIRQILGSQHYNPLIVFAVTAFVASMISGIALKYDLGNNPQIALASSVLLLVPGFPLINSLADILKGHVNMGIGRWVFAVVLTFGSCFGIVLALRVLNIASWGVN